LARKILLADDSVTAQNMGRKILADAGYEVITVNNGSAALKKIGEQRPDLIVLDVYMPGYSGLEVCQRLKEGGDTSRIPILLTVGKLEPFKPEEARRARADGFIVKPFEASELLSALSKLEDKVVPRSESKPGRFARATAAIEENRFDKSTSADEDNGWKSRIVFPKKKEKPVEPEEADDQAIYNPVNKDLRTVVEQKPAGKPQAPRAEEKEEEKVDLGALGSTGLPKDVTPEEIAALAAAAAQMKGKLTEEKAPELVAELPVMKPTELDAPKLEIKAEPQAVAEPVPAPTAEISAAPTATFAEQQGSEKSPEKEGKQSAPEIAPSAADVMAAIANLEKDAGASPQPANSTHDSWPPSKSEKSDEPVTMAVAAPAYSGPAVSRWTAVAVALAPEDAGISLEQEMQKAFAASAGARGGHSVTMSPTPEPAPLPALTTVVEPSSIEAAAPVPAVSVTPATVPPAAVETAAPAATPAADAQTMSAVSSADADVINSAVAELESVAAAYVAEKSATAAPTSSHAVSPAATSEQTTNTVEPPVFEPPIVEQKTAEASPVEASAKEEKPLETKTEEVAVASQILSGSEATLEVAAAVAPVSGTKDQIREEPETNKIEAAKSEVQPAAQEVPAKEESKAKAFEEAAIVSASMVGASIAAAVEVRDERSSKRKNSEEPARASGGFHAGGTEEMAKRESETAAAWASWRKIRETGSATPAQPGSSSEKSDESSPKDAAAMAVAAGAEHSPEDTSLDSDPEIASIVDSVLADMRPKIVEEIARKLGKKK
jgi:CheY-like chemotaxis protein